MPPGPALSSVVLAVVVYRLCNALLVATYFSPDEFWQGPEVAHWIAFGTGNLCVIAVEAKHPSFPVVYWSASVCTQRASHCYMCCHVSCGRTRTVLFASLSLLICGLCAQPSMCTLSPLLTCAFMCNLLRSGHGSGRRPVQFAAWCTLRCMSRASCCFALW
jgi:hypothetical protein